MVKLGFIVEGDTEKMILESKNFKKFLNELKIDFIPEIVNAEGNRNLLPHNIKEHSQILIDKGATKIIVLTDLDDNVCITKTKERIQPLDTHIVVIGVKQIEAWFLADTESMRHLLSDPEFIENDPESHSVPYEEIKQIRITKTGRGTGSKLRLARYIIDQCRFSIKRAAEHPNCSSANYFIKKLKSLAAQ